MNTSNIKLKLYLTFVEFTKTKKRVEALKIFFLLLYVNYKYNVQYYIKTSDKLFSNYSFELEKTSVCVKNSVLYT